MKTILGEGASIPEGLSADQVRIIKGPAMVLVKGGCRLLGSDVSGRTVSVRSGKALPFEPSSGCRLTVKLGRGGRMWRSDATQAGTSIWNDVWRTIASWLHDRQEPLVVMVVGETDTGKSTLCAYLSNIAIGEGFVPCLVDGDIGQGDLAPPSAIGGAVVSHQITDLRDLSANLFEFVGRISPVGIEEIVSEKLRSMLHKLSPLRQLCIVNTDGYVADGGLAYKRMIAEELQPDVVVCIGQNQPLLDSLASDSWQIVLARQSVHARKSVFERSQRRSDQIQKFIGTGLSQVDPSKVAFVYLDKTYSFSQLPVLDAWHPQDGRLTNIFVGLGSRDEVVGFGAVEHADEDILQVRTDIKHFSTLYLSDITVPANHARQVKIL